jgi:predicted HicB family RNase H-like nuclease
MVKKAQFRTPEELAAEKKDKTEAVASRMDAQAKRVLEKAADKQGVSLSFLVGRILEDYAEWLEKNGK